MKPTPKLFFGLAFTAGAIAALRVAQAGASDVRRYNRMRTMSGDGPLTSEIPAIVARVLEAERKALPVLLSTLVTLPSDALRYARMKMM